MPTPVPQLRGSKLATVRRDDDCHEWVFEFSGAIVLRVAAPWRVLSDGAVGLGWEDHDQRFGRSTPVDLATELRALCGTGLVTTASHDTAGDLAVEFESGCVLQVFNASSGYEGWVLQGPGMRWLVAQGGGRVVESEAGG